ncbi:LHFPL tetraspan subfamily member 2 protein-like [Xenia sp. Carnegie-2017]|uniref:LHFPL tetraspan subfamily member 2 protein-like n=1 Tax=Xenia sp. Carnegie-2017 TaxID=2897299 RepID=UPI001F04B6CC|nr:LHFPL tetraspan subfamily member 2 protein-like [Xenia sp. Carnegie-2017]
MGYLIITFRNLLWMLLSLTGVLAIIAAVISPNWNIAYDGYNTKQVNNSIGRKNPTIGLYSRCSRQTLSRNVTRWSCRRYIQSLDDLPSDFWKASLVFMVIGATIASISVIMAITAFCVQKIGKKSLISVVGVIQAFAGLFLMVGVVLWPAGWGNENELFKKYCYKIADDENKPYAFRLGDCTFGWAFYSAIGGTLMIFACAIFSVYAERSTSSDKVQDEIWKGKKVICLP